MSDGGVRRVSDSSDNFTFINTLNICKSVINTSGTTRKDTRKRNIKLNVEKRCLKRGSFGKTTNKKQAPT